MSSLARSRRISLAKDAGQVFMKIGRQMNVSNSFPS